MVELMPLISRGLVLDFDSVVQCYVTYGVSEGQANCSRTLNAAALKRFVFLAVISGLCV